ncbi:hypothetical protein FGG08_004714 [Glutinoglossum americanum]|uniref:Uncharacterized protein n=1 Tax=Glutinoglossum americanum TaxID=1670608 RepID=A0A9P8L2F8_9PEZI|nr:hypothetical protein FGG08_004714 [Glutinoglossum americanum]
MFNRRRHLSISAANPNPDPSAATAAVQAFLSSRASSQSLSSSAAATALRTHVAPPKPVSEVQTKRTLRRQASISSNGSASDSRRGPQRRASSGSMTERTFRDTSPVGVGRGRIRGAPPVPTMPGTVPDPRRAAGLEPLQFSSPESKSAGRGVNTDRTEEHTPHAARISDLDPVVEREFDRMDDTGSVKISYPAKGLNSPKPAPTDGTKLTSGRRPGSPLAGTPSTARGLDSGEVANIHYSMRDAAERPVKRKKKAAAKEAVQGSYLGEGATGGGPRGTVVSKTECDGDADGTYQQRTAKQDEQPMLSTSSAATKAPRKKKKKKKIAPPVEPRESQNLGMEYPSSITSHSSDLDSIPEIVENTRRGQRSRKARAGGQLAKQPSTVREDREREEQEEQGGGKGLESSRWKPGAPSAENKQILQGRSEYPSLVTALPAPATTASPNKESEPGLHPNGHGGAHGNNLPSLSQSRTAHFSTMPLLSTDTDQMRHEPPPRAISPAKSAMKPSPSSRTGSPIGSLLGRGHGQKPGEASDENSLRSEDGEAGYPRGAYKGKKKARVSFDEESVVVGRAATPPTSPDSPVERKGWHSQDKGEARGEGISDQGIKPVPTLPTFDSVRSRRKRADGEEGIEKVTESVPGVSSASVSGSSIKNQMGASSDSALGAVIAHDLASKGAPAPSSSERIERGSSQSSPRQVDPLPPLVTSVEGTGWASDSEESIPDDDSIETYVLLESPSEGVPKLNINGKPPTSPDQDESSHVETGRANGNIPQLILVQPTPTLDETVDREEWLNIPGSFPTGTETETPEGQDARNIVERRATDPTLASLGISEPEPEEAAAYHRSGSPIVGEFGTGLSSHTQVRPEEESDSSGGSIYSDAAEDLSDLEGDGFGSIDAVVESPTVNKIVMLPIAATGLKTAASQTHRPLRPRTGDHAESSSEEDGNRAQIYQPGLRAQKKQQIERAAAPHAPQGTGTLGAQKPSAMKPQPMRVPLKSHRWTESESGYHLDPQAAGRKSPAPGADSVTASGIKKPVRDLATNSSSDNRLRSSMKGSTRTSVRAPPAHPPSANAPHHTEPQHPKGLLQKRHIQSSAPVQAIPLSAPAVGGVHRSMSESTTSHPSPPPVVPASPKKTGKRAALWRTLSNESDSDSGSSFKRRPRTTSGVVGLRKTMRSPPPEPGTPPTIGSGTRPLSPPAGSQRRPFSHGGTLRTTMRDPSARTPSLRSNSPERTRSPIRFSGFGKSSKQKASALQPTRSGFASRFSHSTRPAFRSRFADSSDEDEGVHIPLTPVRGIPRKSGASSRESTELSDSSDYDDNAVARSAPPIKSKRFLEGYGQASSHLRHSGSGRDLTTTARYHTETSKPDLQKTDKKRFTFGSLGRHKKDSTNKVRKSDIESAARRDTPLERSKLELQASKAIASASSPSGGPATVQKKMFRHLVDGDSWPLRRHHYSPKGDAGGVFAGGEAAEANTQGGLKSDGGGISESGGGKRTPSANAGGAYEGGGGEESEGESSVIVVVGRKGRRKRFPFLRRVFGLDEG